jgi:hypothetical protein
VCESVIPAEMVGRTSSEPGKAGQGIERGEASAGCLAKRKKENSRTTVVRHAPSLHPHTQRNNNILSECWTSVGGGVTSGSLNVRCVPTTLLHLFYYTKRLLNIKTGKNIGARQTNC